MGSASASVGHRLPLCVAGIAFAISAILASRLILSRSRKKEESHLPPLIREELVVIPKAVGSQTAQLIIAPSATAFIAGLAMPGDMGRNLLYVGGALLPMTVFAVRPVLDRIEKRFRSKYGFALF